MYRSVFWSFRSMSTLNLRKLATLRWVYRAWYYFRIGYGTYLTFLLGYATTLVTLYYLAVKNMPDLLNIFPHFELFVLVASVVGVPLAVAIGWTHLKRSGLFSSETVVGVESNPYTYRLTPGVTQEAIAPTLLLLLKQNRKILASNKLLRPEDERKIEELERKWQILLSGGYVGQPKRTMKDVA